MVLPGVSQPFRSRRINVGRMLEEQREEAGCMLAGIWLFKKECYETDDQ